MTYVCEYIVLTDWLNTTNFWTCACIIQFCKSFFIFVLSMNRLNLYTHIQWYITNTMLTGAYLRYYTDSWVRHLYFRTNINFNAFCVCVCQQYTWARLYAIKCIRTIQFIQCWKMSSRNKIVALLLVFSLFSNGMTKRTAGLVIFRHVNSELEFLMLKPSKEGKVWSPPKGL